MRFAFKGMSGEKGISFKKAFDLSSFVPLYHPLIGQLAAIASFIHPTMVSALLHFRTTSRVRSVFIR